MRHQLVFDHFQPVPYRLVQIDRIGLGDSLSALYEITHPLDDTLNPVGISRDQPERLHDRFRVKGLLFFKPIDDAICRKFDRLQRLVEFMGNACRHDAKRCHVTRLERRIQGRGQLAFQFLALRDIVAYSGNRDHFAFGIDDGTETILDPNLPAFDIHHALFLQRSAAQGDSFLISGQLVCRRFIPDFMVGPTQDVVHRAAHPGAKSWIGILVPAFAVFLPDKQRNDR